MTAFVAVLSLDARRQLVSLWKSCFWEGGREGGRERERGREGSRKRVRERLSYCFSLVLGQPL